MKRIKKKEGLKLFKKISTNIIKIMENDQAKGEYSFFKIMFDYEGELLYFEDLLEKYTSFSIKNNIPILNEETGKKEHKTIWDKTMNGIINNEIVDIVQNVNLYLIEFLEIEINKEKSFSTKQLEVIESIGESDKNKDTRNYVLGKAITILSNILGYQRDKKKLSLNSEIMNEKRIIFVTNMIKLAPKETKELIKKDWMSFRSDFKEVFRELKNNKPIIIDLQGCKYGLLGKMISHFYFHLSKGKDLNYILDNLETIIDKSGNYFNISDSPIPDFAKIENIDKNIFKPILISLEGFLKEYQFDESEVLKEYDFPKMKLQLIFDLYSYKYKMLVDIKSSKKNTITLDNIKQLLSYYFLLDEKEYPIKELVIYNPIYKSSFSLSIDTLKKYRFFHLGRKFLLEFTQCKNKDLREI